jgi:two-component system sensor histidine kinase BaeS
MRSLRQRLLLSHILPVLVSLPLVGFAFVYVLQTQVLLANLTSDLTSQAVLVAELTTQQPDVWRDPRLAQVFSIRIGDLLPSDLMLFDPEAHLIASSDPGDAEGLGQVYSIPGLADALAGHVGLGLSDPRSPQSDTAVVFVPVFSQTQRVIGVVGLAQRFSDVYARFRNLRTITVGVLLAIILLGGGLGLFLALNIERPLRVVTNAVKDLSSGYTLEKLPGKGPEEVRILQQAFNRLVERLRELEEARRHLLANLVHELGRPLGAMLSAVQALQGGAEGDTALRRELLEGIEGEIYRLQKLTDDLTSLHEQLLGSLELKREPVQLLSWLGDMLPPWREAALDKGLQWEVEIPPEMPAVDFDADRLAQALGNLISNAIQYTPPGGMIGISAGIETQELWLRVSDNGPGIPPEELTRIFTPFYRGTSSTRFPRGMGLGLSIARELVTAHGGRLEVESDLGEGSRFTIRLPLGTSSSS